MNRRTQADSFPRRSGSHVPEQVLKSAPANFTLIYESRDGKMCLFEDADGHVTAVRAARLA